MYKSANVYNSVTDFALFADDAIRTIEAAQGQDGSADPNKTVQSFIDLCARHEQNFYKFVHEVHIHDNGLFDQLMGWLEGILDFLRYGPAGGAMDMNALVQGSLDVGVIDKQKAISEVNALIKWQMARKKWHNDKTRQKMAQGGGDDHLADMLPGFGAFHSSDFGIDESDFQDLGLDDSDSMDDSESDSDSAADPFEAERKRRARINERLRRSAGEPQKPPVQELLKLRPGFLSMLRMVLAE